MADTANRSNKPSTSKRISRKAKLKKITKARNRVILISKFDRENMGLSNYYKEEVLPKLLQTDRQIIIWLIRTHMLPISCSCRMSYQRVVVRLISKPQEIDGHKYLCNCCNDVVPLRKVSIFKDIRCSLANCIRIMYGWVKGMDMDIMTNIVGTRLGDVEKLYNRFSEATRNFIQMKEITHTWKVGGNDIIVLINIYPLTMSEISTKKHCRPIICLSEIRSDPQKYWLEALNYLDESDPEKVETFKEQIIDIVTHTVRPGTTLLLSSPSILFETLKSCSDIYYVLSLDAVAKRDVDGGVSFNAILRTIWKKPLFVCEQAQYYNPNNVEQFLMRNWWRMSAGPFAFEGLLQLLKGMKW